MKTKLQCAALLLPALLLAACARDAQTGDEAAPTPAAAADATPTQPRPLEEALPEGIRPTFAYHLRRDRIEQTKSGAYRRAIRLEYLDMDRQQALQALSADITAAGYKPGKAKQDKKGRTRVTFRKPGQPKIAVIVGTGGKLQHPAARGMIYISIPAKAAAAAPQGGADAR